MMSKILKHITLMIIIFNLIISPCYAGEVLKAGTLLSEDSYVFTLQEAQDLRIKMDNMEKEVEKQEGIVEELEKLDLVHQTKETEFNKIFESEKSQTLLYKELYMDSSDKLSKLENKQAIKDVGLVTIGVLTTIGLILVVNAIDDHVDRTGSLEIDTNFKGLYIKGLCGKAQIKF